MSGGLLVNALLRETHKDIGSGKPNNFSNFMQRLIRR